MSEIKALETLREAIERDVNNPWTDLKGRLIAQVDKVEAEIAERFMELPVDDDGVPIHVGDELSVLDSDFEDGIAEAVGISPDSVFFFDGEDWVAHLASCVSHADKPAGGTDEAQRVSELEAELADAKAEIRRLEAQGEYMCRQIAKAKEALR